MHTITLQKTLGAIVVCFFLLVFTFAPALSQTQQKPSLFENSVLDDHDKLLALGITKTPVQIQLAEPLAKATGKPSLQVPASQTGLTTIMTEDFEGNFPTDLWMVSSGDYTWAKRNCAANGGSFSAWAIGGGSSGSALACGADYSNSITTAMIYGPFDLSDANWAAFSFFVSLNSESGYDYFSFLASDDGTEFSGFSLSGSSGGQWIAFTQALTAVPTAQNTFENFTGKSAVWIAFGFNSDGSVTQPNGAFVDDVVLQKGIVNVPTTVSTFSSPGPSPRGLAFDGADLWCSDATNDRIYKLTTAGSVISSFASPGPVSTGLAWDGANLWNADATNDRIYKLSSSGSVLSSFATPGSIASGLTWDGSGLWNSDVGVPTIWKLNISGGIISSFSAPGTYHYGIAYDGQNLWLADAEALLFYRLDTAGNVSDYYLVPGTFPTGLAWDGTNLWATDPDAGLIYKLQVQVEQVAKDVGVTAIEVPNTVVVGSPNQVTVMVKNFGTEAQSNFPVSYQINSETPVAENFSSTLQPGASAAFTFATPWQPTVSGSYIITSRTALVGDERPDNDAITKTVQASRASTFCSADVPKTISSLSTVTSTLAITNNLVVGDLNVRLYITHSNDTDLDVFLIAPSGKKVELFTDVGGIGSNFGSTCSPQPDFVIDDQAATNIASGSAPFVGSFQSEGLALGGLIGENANGTWVLEITDDASSFSGTLNCWCLEIEPAEPNDVGITAIDLPRLVLLGNSASVNATVRNFGSAAQSNFPVSYSINNGAAVTENLTGTMDPGASVTKTFAAWTPNAEGTYRFNAWTALANDVNAANDTVPAFKEVSVRVANAVPMLAGIGDQTIRAGTTKRIPLMALDVDGDSMRFSIPNNPGFLSLSGFSQSGDTAKVTLVISPSRSLIGGFAANVQVTDQFDAVISIPFNVNVVARLLSAPANLTASIAQNAVQLNWQAPVIRANSPYAGVWSGSTSQNLPVFMSVSDDGFVDSLAVRLRLDFVQFTCTITYIRTSLADIVNDKFDAFLSVVLTNVSTTLHGTFSSQTSVGGTYDGHSGSYFIYCGSVFGFGTGGTQLTAGTWQATRTAPGGGSQPPVLQAYRIYRSQQPNAKGTGSLIGSNNVNTLTFTDSNIDQGTYFYQVAAVYNLGESDPAEEVSILVTAVKDRFAGLPLEYALEQNYPNPFNPETEIRFQLPRPVHVVLKIFNTLGAEVRTLVDRAYQPGYHQVQWDGKDERGLPVASGVYLYKLEAGTYTRVRKMSLLR